MDGPFPRSSSATSVVASVLDATRPSRDLSPTFPIALIGGVALLATAGVASLLLEWSQSAVDTQAALDADPVLTASIKPMLPPVRKVVTTSVRVTIRRADPAMAASGAVEGSETLGPHDPRWARVSNEISAIDFASRMQTARLGQENGTAATSAAVLFDAKEAAADPLPPNVKASTRTVQVNHGVNMRSRPESGSRVLSVVPKGASVELVGCKLWCEISYKGRRGYVFEDFVRGKAPSPAKPKPAAEPITGNQDALYLQPVAAADPVSAAARQSDLAARELRSSPRRHP